MLEKPLQLLAWKAQGRQWQQDDTWSSCVPYWGLHFNASECTLAWDPRNLCTRNGILCDERQVDQLWFMRKCREQKGILWTSDKSLHFKSFRLNGAEKVPWLVWAKNYWCWGSQVAIHHCGVGEIVWRMRKALPSTPNPGTNCVRHLTHWNHC